MKNKSAKAAQMRRSTVFAFMEMVPPWSRASMYGNASSMWAGQDPLTHFCSESGFEDFLMCAKYVLHMLDETRIQGLAAHIWLAERERAYRRLLP